VNTPILQTNERARLFHGNVQLIVNTQNKNSKPKIKYVGHIIGSGKRLPDPEKMKAVMNLKVPETKKNRGC